MGRILAIDYGVKRVGLAVTDPLKLIATPLATVHAEDLEAYLKDYLALEAVDAFVLGMPYNLDKSSTNNTQHVVGFGRKLAKLFPGIPVRFVDERYTSKLALRAMIEGGTKKKYRQEKSNMDKISATIILQSYMEQNK